MHFLERYALSTGLRISRPFIKKSEIDLPDGKFFTIHCDSESKSKTYWHWGIVINELRKECENKGVKIVQVGVGGKAHKNVVDYVDKTSFNQLAFLLERSLFHVGIDSSPAHIADSYDKDCVILYSTYPQNCRPYFGGGKKVLLSPDFAKIKPSFSVSDFRINEISPAKIIDEVRAMLESNLSKV